MLSYYLKLAFRSFARTPGLTVLMIATIALGVAVSAVTVSVYHIVAGNPIWWKNDRLYAVTMDNWPASMSPASGIPHVELGPSMLTYRDATRLFTGASAERRVIMFATRGVLSGGLSRRPMRARTRVTTADFFAMFDVPFLYGSGWSAAADSKPEPVIVLSRQTNERMFGGSNSVGRTIRWNDHEFRIVGVLDGWMPQPKFYDLNDGTNAAPEDVYIPWQWGVALQLPADAEACFTAQPIRTFQDMLGSECIWIEMWAELPDAASRERMLTFMNQYWTQERKAGRFPRAMNNRLTNVAQWLETRSLTGGGERLLVSAGFAFFAVCLFNVAGLVLAKFLGRASSTGVRRALGASRREIVLQHLVEASVLAGCGAAVGVLMSELGLWGVRVWMAFVRSDSGHYHAALQFDSLTLAWAIGLAVVAAFAAGLYPAWRVGRLAPASYIKAQ